VDVPARSDSSARRRRGGSGETRVSAGQRTIRPVRSAGSVYSFTSPLYPTRCSSSTGERHQHAVRAAEVEFDASLYETEQVFATSKDGTRFAIFITHKKNLTKDGKNPTMLYGSAASTFRKCGFRPDVPAF